MNIGRFFKQAERLVTSNSPLILTGLGVAGTLTTAYFTGRASFKAAEILDDEQYQRNVTRLSHEPRVALSGREKFELTWKLYIPAIGVGSFTIASIIFANRIGTRRAAAMAAAYTTMEHVLTEYRTKVVDTIGEAKEKKIRDEIAQDTVRRVIPAGSEVVLAVSTGDQLCMDGMSGRPFASNYEKLRKAENDINFHILNSGDDYATVTMFYNMIGLPPTDISDELGWNTDKKLTLHYSPVLNEDNQAVLVVNFGSMPIPDPWRFV